MAPNPPPALRAIVPGLLLIASLSCGARPEPSREAPQMAPPHELGYQLEELLDALSPERWREVEERVGETGAQERILLADDMWAINLTSDHWTTATPAAVVVENDSDQELRPLLALVTYAPPEVRPPVVLHDGSERRVFELDPPRQQVELAPVPAGSSRMYLLGTEGTWQPGSQDRRQLGVRIVVQEQVPERF
jgi:hypothetical protein